MATITGLTAARMLDIEAASVADADLDNVTGELTFTTHGGTVIHVGNVRAPSTIPELLAAALPSAYPHGMTQFTFLNTSGWPTATGTVFTVLESVARAFQLVSEKASAPGGQAKIWMRTAAQDAWSAWYQIADKTYVDTQIATLSTARLDYLDGVVKGVNIPTGVDLNSYTAPGVFWQASNAFAAAGLNYPEAHAGLLEVFTQVVNHVWQRYTPYAAYGDHFWERAWYSSTGWGPWRKFVADDDTGWVDAVAAGFTGVSGSTTLTSGFARKRFGNVSVQLVGTTVVARTAGDIANFAMWNLPTGWIPEQANGALSSASQGASYSAYASGSGAAITCTTVSTAMAAGAPLSTVGYYML